MIVGLTGGIASGKTTVANLFAEFGVPIVDADLVAREIVEPGQPALAEISDHFGPSVLQSNGQLDRARLRELIFADATERKWLEQCLHPRIQQRMKQAIEAIQQPYALLVVPLMVESGFNTLCNRILVVDIDESLQLQRVCQRDQIGLEQARRILASQASRQQRLAIADELITNQGSLQELHKSVEILHKKYSQLAKADDSPEPNR